MNMPGMMESIYKRNAEVLSGVNLGLGMTNGLGHTARSLGLVRDPLPPAPLVLPEPGYA